MLFDLVCDLQGTDLNLPAERLLTSLTGRSASCGKCCLQTWKRSASYVRNHGTVFDLQANAFRGFFRWICALPLSHSVGYKHMKAADLVRLQPHLDEEDLHHPSGRCSEGLCQKDCVTSKPNFPLNDSETLWFRTRSLLIYSTVLKRTNLQASSTFRMAGSVQRES